MLFSHPRELQLKETNRGVHKSTFGNRHSSINNNPKQENSMISEATKTILAGTVREWNKFKTEQIKLSLVANDIAAITSRVILEQLQYLKAQSIEVQCDSVDNMGVLNVPIVVQPIIEAVFPNSKASVLLKCAGAARMIIINPNLSIYAGGILRSRTSSCNGWCPSRLRRMRLNLCATRF